MKNQPKLEDLLKKVIPLAMKDVAMHLDARFTEEISAEKWPYPTPPEIRDIVDTGRLRASQTRRVDPETGEVQFFWPVQYARNVHEGGVDTYGRPFPARRWTEAPMAEVPKVFGEAMGKHIHRELNGYVKPDPNENHNPQSQQEEMKTDTSGKARGEKL